MPKSTRAEPVSWTVGDLLPDHLLDTSFRGWKIASLGGHALRVAAYAFTIANAYGLDEQRSERLRQAAAFHDIGKWMIPRSILDKPGTLSPVERLAVQSHTTKGYLMLLAFELPTLQEAAMIAQCHHEHLDGSGYPKQRKGHEIPLNARIVSVADVFDALTSHRTYRAAMSESAALAMIERSRGSRFDPLVVHALVRALENYPDLVTKLHSFTEAMPESTPSSVHTREDDGPDTRYLRVWEDLYYHRS